MLQPRLDRRAAVVAIALALSLVTAGLGAAAKRKGALTVSLLGAGSAKKSVRTVTLIAADTGEIVGTTALGRRSKIVLRPAPGVLFALGSATSARETRSAVSRALLVAPTKASRVSLRLRRPSGNRSAVRPLGVAGTGGSGLTASIVPIPVTIDGVSSGSYSHPILTGVYNDTSALGVTWVNGDAVVTEQRNRQIELQDQGRIDPSTHITGDLIPADVIVEGGLNVVDGHLTGEIRVIDAKTGEVIDRIPIDRDYDPKSFDDFDKLINDLIRDLIPLIIKLIPTTTTTTTITTTTTSTTTTTTVTSTTATTSITLPPTTTTVSTSSTTTLPCTGALASAVVLEDISASAWSVQAGTPSTPDTYDPPTQTIPLGPAGGNGGPEWTLLDTAGTAISKSTGDIVWEVSPCAISAHGTFEEEAVGGDQTHTATTGLDARITIRFTGAQHVPYRLTGSVKASGKAKIGPSTTYFLKCHGNYGQTEVSLVSPTGPTGVLTPFTHDTEIFPQEEHEITCALHRGSASAANDPGTDTGNLEWSFAITFGGPP